MMKNTQTQEIEQWMMQEERMMRVSWRRGY